METGTNGIRKAGIRFRLTSLWAYVYFFFNTVGLPHGLLVTNLCTPVFYIWLWSKKQRFILIGLFLFLIPYDIIHLLLGVDMMSFLKSNLLFISTYIFVVTFVYFIGHTHHLRVLFKQLLVANIVFTLIACVIFFTPWRETLWYVKKFTVSVDSLPRLALLTYEASYYALLFVPVAFYFLLKVLLDQNRTKGIYILIMVLLPILLSLSIGVIAASFLAFLFLFIKYKDLLLKRKRVLMTLFFGTTFIFAIVVFLGLFFPDNPIFIRIANIITGVDTSANGRTIDSFTMAFRMANLKSLVFGVGLGQIKILGPEVVRQYYYYWGNPEVIRIPNALAETLAIFGLSGILLRFLIIFYLFLKTKVLSNYYRTALFIFIFVYQFTGSYIMNIAEYVIWALAFSNVFKQFDVQKE